MPPPPSRFSHRRGSVIVLVLAMVALASFLLSRFVERAMTEMLVESRAHHAAQLRAEAYSALEATLAVLASYQAEDNGLRSPAQGWGDPLAGTDFEPRAGTTVEVAFEDESGKLSLPRLDGPALEQLGRQLGLTEIDATRFADALLGWVRRDHVPTQYEGDPRKYEYEDPPHRAPGRALESFDELAAIAVVRDLFFDAAGQPTEVRGRFVETVSLYDFPAVNVNGARIEALALAGLDPTQAGRLSDFNEGRVGGSRRAVKYFRNIAEVQTVVGSVVPLNGFDTLVQVLRIHVTVRQGGSALRLSAVVRPGQSTAAQAAPNPETEGAATPAPAGNTAAGGALEYPFTVLAVDESVELQPASSP